MRWLFILLVVFLFIGSWMIISSQHLNPDNAEDRNIFVKETGKWIKNVGTNVWELTGKAIQQRWLPETKKEVNETKNERE